MKKKRTKRAELEWPDDPVVEEIHRIRRRMLKEAGGTVEGLIDLVNKRHSERPAKAKAAKPRKRRAA